MLLLAVLLPAVALLLPDLLTAALLPLLFCCRIGLVPVCGAGASQASVAIYRAKVRTAYQV